ncbi:uncharacterized protein METZ01_LOCUS98561 [marine metagenome]|uniref:4-hydroxy-tetrahydrodipicolinate synthase n=1 Tax=marine metagenome TaxID=408172 RepID=A0A381W1D8_9ZZZZ|tara:strand:- start:1649 stop:2524 length:876 start_codon:yes stop_codon:yes gene_type:complete
MFKGSIVALVTPFKDNKIDEESLRNLVEWHIKEGTNGIVPVGTTGESPTLDHDEHKSVVEIVIDQNNGRIPIIAGTGSNSTKEAINLLEHAESSGANAALVVTPYYNKPTPEGIYQHYKALDECSKNLPIIIYNIPSRSVIDIKPKEMGRLSKLEKIVGVKDATSEIVRVLEHKEFCGDNFIQLSGEDETIFDFMQAGGHGCISVTANIIPNVCAKLHKLFEEEKINDALKINNSIMSLHKVLFLETSPAPVKYALCKLGLIEDTLRLPLVSVQQETKNNIDQVLSALELI